MADLICINPRIMVNIKKCHERSNVLLKAFSRTLQDLEFFCLEWCCSTVILSRSTHKVITCKSERRVAEMMTVGREQLTN